MFELKGDDVGGVSSVIKTGKSAREICHAHALNLRHKGYTVIEVSDILDITPRTVINITTAYRDDGLIRALRDDPRPGQPIKFDDRIKSKIIAIICTDPPEGFDRWTLELIQEKVKKNKIVDAISKESIRIIMQEHDLKPWQQKMWCVPKLDGEYIERMENILDLYERSYDSNYPVVCVDEKPVQLLGDKRESKPCSPGSQKKVDYEYVRNGSANVFCAIEPLQGKYTNKVTKTKSGKEFGIFLGQIEKQYESAKKIILVMDNFFSHFKKSVIAAHGPEEGGRIWDRFEIYYTPKHASWLNQGEIAIGMYSRQCLGDTRIENIESLTKKTKAWARVANTKKVKIQWNFSVDDARDKFEYSETIK
jgi:transposase